MKKNLFYSIVIILINTLYPVIVFPYISRIFSVESVGIYNYYNLLFGYLVIFSNFGIGLYASKEIGKYKDKPIEKDKKVLELLCLNFINALIVIGLVVVPLYIISVDENKHYLLLFSIMLLSNSLSIEWYFVATENQSFVFYRNILVKIGSLILIYILIKDDDDLAVYILIVVLGLLINSIINLFHFFKQISCPVRFSLPLYHVRFLLVIFLIEIFFRFYGMADIAFSEKWLSKTQLGYLTFALSIYNILSSFLKIIATTLLPRASFYLENDELGNFRTLVTSSISIIFFVGLPACLFIFFWSDDMVRILGGEKYLISSDILKSFSILLILSSIINVFIFQYLYPLGKTKVILLSLFISILGNVCLNYLLLDIFKEYAIIISSVISHLIILFLFYRGEKSEFLTFFSSDIAKYVIAAILSGLTIYTISHFPVLKFDDYRLVAFCLGFLLYLIVIYFSKDKLMFGFIQNFREQRSNEKN